MLTGIDLSASVVWTDISSIFIATSNLFVDTGELVEVNSL